MESHKGKSGSTRNILVWVFSISVLVILFRFSYVVTIRGESCDLGNFCFFASPENFTGIRTDMVTQALDGSASAVNDLVRSGRTRVSNLWTTRDYRKAVQSYSSIFQDLAAQGFLSSSSKSLCVETPTGQDVFALKEMGVSDAIGTAKKAFKPLVLKADPHHLHFENDTFDFVFSSGGLDGSHRPFDFASEIARTVRPDGFVVIHTRSTDTYSLNSILALFHRCSFVRSKAIDGFDRHPLREIVMKKESNLTDRSPTKNCSVPLYKIFSEPLIEEEPLKPWITLKKNMKNVKYFPSMVDISFKERYVYVDVGSRSYGSSLVSWFKKQYPKQNKTFDVYAIEADRAFHEEYRMKKGVTLLPYAAWVRNETLLFEINGDPGHEEDEKTRGRGMGRIRPSQNGRIPKGGSNVNEIQGFDFAVWLKNTVTERDFVVMKMDIEGTEFDLIPRLFETGAICLIDEFFLECHYNRWQRCCPGERSTKYKRTYPQCLDLFTSLRQSGVLVHQWW